MRALDVDHRERVPERGGILRVAEFSSDGPNRLVLSEYECYMNHPFDVHELLTQSRVGLACRDREGRNAVSQLTPLDDDVPRRGAVASIHGYPNPMVTMSVSRRPFVQIRIRVLDVGTSV